MQYLDAFSGFSTPNLEEAKEFYSETLGLEVETTPQGLSLELAGGTKVFIYPKDNHQAATFTVLNLVVSDIDVAVDELASKSVSFEKYDGFGQDERGIARSPSPDKGPDIAWFKDPAGNIIAVLQTDK